MLYKYSITLHYIKHTQCPAPILLRALFETTALIYTLQLAIQHIEQIFIDPSKNRLKMKNTDLPKGTTTYDLKSLKVVDTQFRSFQSKKFRFPHCMQESLLGFLQSKQCIKYLILTAKCHPIILNQATFIRRTFK